MQHYSTQHSINTPAFRLVGDCPACHRPLVVRYTRQGHQPFIGCSYYPMCRFTTEFEEALQDLGEQLTALRHDYLCLDGRNMDLLNQIIHLKGQIARLGQSEPPSYAHVGALDAGRLDKALLTLVALCHPDRWQNHPAATELSKAVLGLRQRVKEGRV